MWNRMCVIVIATSIAMNIVFGADGENAAQTRIRNVFDQIPAFKGCKITPFPAEAINRELKKEGQMLCYQMMELSLDGRFIQIGTMDIEDPEYNVDKSVNVGTIVELATANTGTGYVFQ